MMPPPTTSSQSLGQRVDLERARGVDDARIIGQSGQHHRFRAGRDDALLERYRFAIVEHEFVRRREFGRAVYDTYLALLRKLSQAAGQLADNRVLPATQFERIDFRLAEFDAVLRHRRSLVDDLRCMQQGLGRNAADVETDPAERVLTLHQDDVHAEVGRAERSRVAARAGADDDELCLVVGHYGVARSKVSTSASCWPRKVVKRTAAAPSMTR